MHNEPYSAFDKTHFTNEVGLDIYYNPWWGLDTASYGGQIMAKHLDQLFGSPDLWFNGCFHELLWGPRDLQKGWRPSFHINWSGPQHQYWRQFWLPWEGQLQTNPLRPYSCNVRDILINSAHVQGAHDYAKAMPFLQTELASGAVLLTMALRNNNGND